MPLIFRILYLYTQEFLLWVGNIRMASIIVWTTVVGSASVTAVHVAHYYLFLDPDELWTYNYCMHLPFVETDRRSIVDSFMVLSLFLCNLLELGGHSKS